MSNDLDDIFTGMCCLTCENCIPLGEDGVHVCFEASTEPIVVLEEYEPTDDYFACGGADYEPSCGDSDED